MIGFSIGLILISLVVAQSFLFAVGTLSSAMRRRIGWRREREEFARRVVAKARTARATKAIPDWEGWRQFRVVATVDEAHDTRSFYLSPVDGRTLPPFAPGQYLTFRLQPPGAKGPLVRCYSLSDHSHEDYYRVTVKRIGPPDNRPELPGGRGSNYFHDHVHVGEVVDVRAPAGTFLLDTTDSEPVVLIGAGIGVTPLVSMLGATIHAGRRRPVYALLGFRNGREHPFKEHLESLAEQHRNLHMHVSYSAPDSNDVQYKDFNHYGRISLERLREILPSNNFHFYLCGPGPMMESLVPELLEWGVPESHIHYEAFGPASVKSKGFKKHTEPCEVGFSRSGETYAWDDSQGSLLEFAEKHGMRIPFGCRAGSCGECLTGLQAGQVLPLKDSGFPVPPGYCLTCISVPAGPVTLDA